MKTSYYKVVAKTGMFKKEEIECEEYAEAVYWWLMFKRCSGVRKAKIYERAFKWVDKQGELGIETRSVATRRWKRMPDPDLSYALGDYYWLREMAEDWGEDYYRSYVDTYLDGVVLTDSEEGEKEIEAAMLECWGECEMDTDYMMTYAFVDEIAEEKGVDDVDLTGTDEALLHYMIMRGVNCAYDNDEAYDYLPDAIKDKEENKEALFSF